MDKPKRQRIITVNGINVSGINLLDINPTLNTVINNQSYTNLLNRIKALENYIIALEKTYKIIDADGNVVEFEKISQIIPDQL